MKLSFFGAAQTVTGSRTLISHFGKKVLVDCGMFQGPKEKRLLNWNSFYDPRQIDAILLTHAHIDHSGYLPKFVKEGYRGPIFCSQGTKDLCEILLRDAAKLQMEDADYANESGYSHHTPALPLYNIDDAELAIKQLVVIKQNEWHKLSDQLSFRFIRSGHIIGSSFIQVSYVVADQGVRLITFSGDLGSFRSKTLRPPQFLTETDELVLESTYGDRLQPRENPEILLKHLIDKIIERKSVLLIPAFAVGRTQEILYLLRSLEDKGEIPKIAVFLDSPMGVDATSIFINHPEEHLLEMKGNELACPICTNSFHAVTEVRGSKDLSQRSGPMIIISSAGMMNGGRVMHHLKKRLPDEKNILLIVGYMAEGTKGRLLKEGISSIRIHHEEIPVRAEIQSLDSLSAHADQEEILKWVSGFTKKPSKIFLNHGEPAVTSKLAQKIKEQFSSEVKGVICPEVICPTMGSEWVLDEKLK